MKVLVEAQMFGNPIHFPVWVHFIYYAILLIVISGIQLWVSVLISWPASELSSIKAKFSTVVYFSFVFGFISLILSFFVMVCFNVGDMIATTYIDDSGTFTYHRERPYYVLTGIDLLFSVLGAVYGRYRSRKKG